MEKTIASGSRADHADNEGTAELAISAGRCWTSHQIACFVLDCIIIVLTVLDLVRGVPSASIFCVSSAGRDHVGDLVVRRQTLLDLLILFGEEMAVDSTSGSLGSILVLRGLHGLFQLQRFLSAAVPFSFVPPFASLSYCALAASYSFRYCSFS